MYCGEDFLSANTLSRLSTTTTITTLDSGPAGGGLAVCRCRASALGFIYEKAVVAKTTLFYLTNAVDRKNKITIQKQIQIA